MDATDPLHEVLRPYDLFPVSADYSLTRLNKQTGADGYFYDDFRIGDGVTDKGFADCDRVDTTMIEAVTGINTYLTWNMGCRMGAFIYRDPQFHCQNDTLWLAVIDDDYVVTQSEMIRFL